MALRDIVTAIGAALTDLQSAEVRGANLRATGRLLGADGVGSYATQSAQGAGRPCGHCFGWEGRGNELLRINPFRLITQYR